MTTPPMAARSLSLNELLVRSGLAEDERAAAKLIVGAMLVQWARAMREFCNRGNMHAWSSSETSTQSKPQP